MVVAEPESVNLDEGVFRCFDARCDKQGDVIDLWAALHQQSLREAALDLVRTFNLEPAPATGTEPGTAPSWSAIDTGP